MTTTRRVNTGLDRFVRSGSAVFTRLKIRCPNDSSLFSTRHDLVQNGAITDANRFVDPQDNRKSWLPLYEAKMMWQFDDRFATYEGADTRNSTIAEKQDPMFSVMPRYWVEAREVYWRSAVLPSALLQAIRDGNAELITLALAHLMFGNSLLQKQQHGTTEIFRAWCSFIREHPFARQLAPTQMGLCGNNPACFSPLDDSYLPGVPVSEIKPNERDAAAWYAVDPRTVKRVFSICFHFSH